MKQRFLFASSLLVILISLVSQAAAAPYHGPYSEDKARVRAAGEPLESLFSRLGKTYRVPLRASGELKQQRVTLFFPDTKLETVAQLLTELLTPASQASASWTKESKAWTLTESLNRRLLAERLQNQDLELYRQHLETEVAWLRQEEEREAKGEPAREDPQADQDALRRIRIQRVALARYMEWLGPAGQGKLLSGEPTSSSVGKMPVKLRQSFYAYLRQTLRSIASLSDEKVDNYTVAYLLARSPTGNRFTRLFESIITPEGYVRSRSSVMNLPQPAVPAFLHPPFSLAQIDPANPSRRVSLILGATPNARPGTRVFRNLDELLEEVSSGADLQVIADGYLRTRRVVPANMRVQAYPLGQLLDRLARTWDCEWRWVGEGEKTVLLRARNWWMEDAVDVPESLLQEIHPRLNRKKVPELTDLLRLAELSKAQVHKLIEAGYCPDASGLVQPSAYDDTGPKSVLQFFSRLPAPLQARVKSPEGMRLGEAPADLVRTWQSKTLIAYGTTEPKAWTQITFRIETKADDASAPGAIVVLLVGSLGENARWMISPVADEARQLRIRENG